MDTAVVILLVVLLIVFGIFFITMTGSGDSGATGYATQSPQYTGGGCGR